MFKNSIFVLLIILGILITIIFLLVPTAEGDKQNKLLISAEQSLITTPNYLVLPVPYVSEMPNGLRNRPWINSCEEASITMVDHYYRGDKNGTVSLQESIPFMKKLFTSQDKLYGSNDNSDVERTVKLTRDYANFQTKIIEDPKTKDIIDELIAGHPVIVPHYGFDLENPHLPFALKGSSYHMTVVVGYDNEAKQFIVNDSGDEIDGLNHRYQFDLFMNSIHDYNHQTDKADGPARVIFTSN